MAKTQDTSGGSGPPNLDRPQDDEASVIVREGGRQLLISREDFPSSDPDDPWDSSSDSDSDSCDNGNSQRGGKRGNVDGFSSCSRRRLRETLHAIDRSADGLFLTLTYHEHMPTPGECKRDLDAWWKRVERRFGGLSAIWKLEPQERGHPHFHLMIFGTGFIDVEWLTTSWHEVTAETSSQHEKSGVEVESFVNVDGRIQSYISKYMSEEYDGWPGAEEGDPWAEMGRWWGCLGRDCLPVAEWADWRVHLTQAEAVGLIRELLAEWGVDIPTGVVPPSLMVNCHGSSTDRLDRLLARLD